jgi:large subunit ribosomal protein L25
MAITNLSVETRAAAGKGVARKLRAAGRVPGILYHAKAEPKMLSVDVHTLFLLLRKPQTLINLELSDGSKELAVIKDVALDPIRDEPIHIDFLGVTKGEKFSVSVPVRLTGEPAGLKMGGVLEQLIYELDISVLPMKLPEAIEVDVTALEIGDSIHIGDIDQSDYEVLADAETTVAQLIAERAELSVETEEEEVESDALEADEGQPAEAEESQIEE